MKSLVQKTDTPLRSIIKKVNPPPESLSQNVELPNEAMRNPDPPQPKYKCSHCDMSSQKEYAVRLHTKVKHDKIKDFPCPMCKYLSGRPSDLKTHIKRHDIPSEFVPLFSDGGVKAAKQEEKGVKYVLKKIRHFACPRCKYLTRWLVDLRRHLAAQHGHGEAKSRG